MATATLIVVALLIAVLGVGCAGHAGEMKGKKQRGFGFSFIWGLILMTAGLALSFTAGTL